ncbi:MAG: hypothetical protein V3U37_04905 [Nitrospinaceae bacterium]
MRRLITKNTFLWAGIFLFILQCPGTADAEYKKKISVQLFANPAGWEEAYSPGALVSDVLQRFLGDKGNFQIVPNPDPSKLVVQSMPKMGAKPGGKKKEEMTAMGPTVAGKEKDKEMIPGKKKEAGQMRVPNISRIMNMAHPAQYIVKGRVLALSTKTLPGMVDPINKTTAPPRERTEIAVEVEVVKHHTDRTIARKTFHYISDDGREPFKPESVSAGIQSPAFRQSSLGLALQKFERDSSSFIYQNLKVLPLEGEIIFLDEKQGEVVINLGRENGVRVRDSFAIFSIDLRYSDPLSKTDLGDRLTRLGMIKVREVQDRFSRAEIVAGKDFSLGDLVRFPLSRFMIN